MNPRPSTAAALCGAAALALSGAAAGCRSADGRMPRVSDSGDTPFVPQRLRVHPLTRFELNEASEPVLVLHVEFRDAWSDNTKAVGALVVELFRDATPGVAGAERTWDVDLSDLTLNASLYDAATATYVIPLGGLPDWAGPFAEGRDPGGRPPLVRVRLGRGAGDAEGVAGPLRDAYAIR